MTSLREKAQGNILIFFAMALTVILAFVALAIDVGGAYRLSTYQQETLELSKEACQASLNYLKFSNNPETDTGYRIVQTMKNNGYEGDVEVYYFEQPQSVTGVTERHCVVGVNVTKDHKTGFAAVVGIDKLPVSNSIVWTSKPYSSTQVWRPTGSHSKKIVYSITSSGYLTKSQTTIASVNDLPAAMADAVKAM